TYEGLSFSWRLKADNHHAFTAKMFVRDPMILSSDRTGHTQINWNEWQGERVIYRRVSPGRIDWSLLPEIVVTLEPIVGERILYNPIAGNPRTEAEARDRVTRLWQDLY